MSVIAAVLAGSSSTAAQAQTGRGLRPLPALTSQALYAFNTGLALTVAQKAAAGAHVQIKSPAGLSGQAWSLNAKGNLTPSSNSHLCLHEVTARKNHPSLDVRKCDGSAAEKFVTSAPTGHTPVFFISPRADQKLCVTAQLRVGLESTSVITPIVGLGPCANRQGQAWSTTNLQNEVGQFGLLSLKTMMVTGQGRPGGLVQLSRVTNSLSDEWSLTPGPSGLTFSPIEDTSSCLTAGSVGQQLRLSLCNGSKAQTILPILLRPTVQFATYLLAVDGAQHCLTWGKVLKWISPALVGPCPNSGTTSTQGIWFTEDSNTYNAQLPSISLDFADLFDDSQNFSNEFGMAEHGTVSGTAVTLASAQDGYAQAWTDLRPGTSSAGNADGSISIRPVNDLHLCLTVPGAKYKAGTKLQVQTCNGAADQEFAGTMPSVSGLSGPAVFTPFSDSSLCVTPLSGVKAASSIGLKACPSPQTLAQDDTWQGFEIMTNWVTPQS